MNYKTLKIKDESSTLSVAINNHDLIMIEVKDHDDHDSNYYGIIEFDKEDAIALRNELDELINSLS